MGVAGWRGSTMDLCPIIIIIIIIIIRGLSVM